MQKTIKNENDASFDDVKSLQFAKANRVKSLRKMTRLSRRAFAERYKIPASTLQNWEDNVSNGLTDKGALKIIKVLKTAGIICSFEWLMYGIGPGPQITERLFLEDVDLLRKKTEVSSELDEEATCIAKELLLFREHYPYAIDYVVMDDGMEPRYLLNEHVAGVRCYDSEIARIVNQDCIIQTQEGDVLLRQIKKGSIEGCYNLVCTNPHTSVQRPVLYDVKLISAAPVVWARRRSKL